MAKYIMKGGSALVVLFENSLRHFLPGEVVESRESPHRWFKLVDPPKPVVKTKPKQVTNKPLRFKE